MPCYAGYTTTGGRFHLCGKLGPHCFDHRCMDVGIYLCDYPVGDGKTCDMPLCESHAFEVAPNVHYCPGHALMWARNHWLRRTIDPRPSISWAQSLQDKCDQAAEIARLREALRIAVGALDNAADDFDRERAVSCHELRFHSARARAALAQEQGEHNELN